MSEVRATRKDSVDSNISMESNATFDAEMDTFLDELMNKKKSSDGSSKKEIEEDNISEEKVKRELSENEKGDRQPSPEPTPPAVSREEEDRPWSASPDRDTWSSPEPDDPHSVTPADPAQGGGRPTSDDDEEEEMSDYDITDDQQKAMRELNQMKLDLQDVAYTEEDPPEYDVAERVRQLNEELANDPTPLEDDRERSIKFKDNLIDLVAPPPDYPSDEEDGGPSPAARGRGGLRFATGTDAPQHPGTDNVSELNIGELKLNDKDRGEEAAAGDAGDAGDADRRPQTAGGDARRTDNVGVGDGEAAAGRRKKTSGKSAKEEEKVLVQRGKTFELISPSDLTAEEREIFLPPPDTDDDDDDGGGGGGDQEQDASRTASSSSDASSSLQPTPPREPRPSTASGAQNRRPLVPQQRRRAQSAVPARRTTSNGVHLNNDYQSPYALPPDMKKLGERQRHDKEKRERQMKELKRMENDQKDRENNEAFLAWLKNKRSQNAWRRESTGDEDTTQKKKAEKVHSDDESSQDKEADAAFREWLKTKKVQHRREREVDERRQQEEQQGWYERPRQDCDKAFRQWLKKKNQDSKNAKKQEVARARMSKLLVRRTRKAMQLARAIRQSQSFRYVDYYGYRY